jgi:cytidyltransferase-like protein
VIVYSYYVMDILHDGHLEMLRNSKAVAGPDGKLIVGILTDEAVMEKKPRPILPFGQRLRIAQAIRYVDLAVAQETYSPLPNVLAIRPDVLMESSSHMPEAIEEARRVMGSLGGHVIVLPYYPLESSTAVKNRVRNETSNCSDNL